MKIAPFTRRELGFLALSAAAAAVSIGLAVCFAPPFSSEREASTQPPLAEAARVDLNTAGPSALCTLPGIGEKRAQAIIDYRQQNGPFRHVEDVANIPGITLEMVRSWRELAFVD